MPKAKITADFSISDVLEKYPEKTEILSENLQAVCLGCPNRQAETLAEAAEHHGIKIEKLLEDLNKE